MTAEPLDGQQTVATAPAHRNMGRTAVWLGRQAELCLTTLDLSSSQYRLLSLLDEGSAIASALAERLAVRPPSVTAVMDGLVSRGLVARHHKEDDRRRVSHELTIEGRRVLEAADTAIAGRFEMLADRLPTARAKEKALESLSLWHQALLVHKQDLIIQKQDLIAEKKFAHKQEEGHRR